MGWVISASAIGRDHISASPRPPAALAQHPPVLLRTVPRDVFAHGARQGLVPAAAIEPATAGWAVGVDAAALLGQIDAAPVGAAAQKPGRTLRRRDRLDVVPLLAVG